MKRTIEIIERRADWIAVNKPAGISVHNTEKGANLLTILRKQLGYSLHAAHRLDSPTSGVILLGKNARGTQMIQQALTTATKQYTAILRGVLKKTEGEWTWSLTNKGEGFKNPRGRKADQVKAQTSFKTIQANQYLTMVSLTLGTGRQHQIRKHAALAKHAVIGDLRYGDKRYNAKLTQRYGINQLCLCASQLEVVLDSEPLLLNVALPTMWSSFFNADTKS
jgi:23S rRNA-/tRNA-specific pseudouridylate synthase